MNIGDTQSSPVPSRDEWKHTGIMLDAGATYALRATGHWTDLFLGYGPEGGPSRLDYLKSYESRRRMPNENWFILCGALDEDDSTQFAIGAGLTYPAPRSGELTCFANDLPGWFFRINNFGSVTLTVTRIS